MFPSYSSLTLQLLQIKKKIEEKSAAYITFPHTERIFCTMLSPEPLQTDKGKGKLEVCSWDHVVTLRGSQKRAICFPQPQSKHLGLQQHKGSTIQINGHGPKLLLSFVKANTVSFIWASEQLQLFLCTMHNAQIVGGVSLCWKDCSMQHAQCAAVYFHDTKKAGVTCINDFQPASKKVSNKM